MGVTVQQGYTSGGGFTAATQAEQEAASSTAVGVAPGVQQYHPSAAKCWASVTYSAGTPTLQTGFNITSITDTNTGDLTITIGTDFSSADWAALVSYRALTGVQVALTEVGQQSIETLAAGSINILTHEPAGGADGTLLDPLAMYMVGFGDQA